MSFNTRFSFLSGLLCAGFVLVAPLSAQCVSAGSLSVPRSEVSAVKLLNGRLLVAGGKRNFGTYTAPVKTSEVYSPATGSVLTAPMLTGRFSHTLTLLANGKVLATGGSYADSRNRYAMAPQLATAELFDPATGSWTATGSMLDMRVGHDAALMKNDHVLVVGGMSPKVEVYNPATGLFTVVGKLATNRSNPKLVVLNDGRVLILGLGWSGDSVIDHSAEIYDPSTNAITLTSPMCMERSTRFTATKLMDGRVLVAGGDSDVAQGGTYELFNPTTNCFVFLGHMSTDREGHTATLYSDGSVLFAGGIGVTNRAPNGSQSFAPPISGALMSIERFYPSAMASSVVGNLLQARSGHAAFVYQKTYCVLGGDSGQASLSAINGMVIR